MRNPQSDLEFCEKIQQLESEIEMIEDSLSSNRNPFERKKQQSQLYEKRKQLLRVRVKYDKFIQYKEASK